MLNCVLLVMHFYWWSFLMVSGWLLLNGKGAHDVHDKNSSLEQEKSEKRIAGDEGDNESSSLQGNTVKIPVSDQ